MKSVRILGIVTALALVTTQLAVFPASSRASAVPGLHPQSPGSHAQVGHPGKTSKSSKTTKKSSRRVSQQVSEGLRICQYVNGIPAPWSITLLFYIQAATTPLRMTLTSDMPCMGLADPNGGGLLPIPVGTLVRIVESPVPAGNTVTFSLASTTPGPLLPCTPAANGCAILTIASGGNVLQVVNTVTGPGPCPSASPAPYIDYRPSGPSFGFSVCFPSTTAGQGYVLFGPGPGCIGLVGLATKDIGAGTTQHLVIVTGDEMNLAAGAILPGTTYSFEVETVTASGVEVDNNGGKCYTVTIPTPAP